MRLIALRKKDSINPQDKSVRLPAVAFLLIVCVLLAGGSATNVIALEKVERASRQVTDVSNPKVRAAADFRLSVATLYQLENGYVLSDHADRRAKFLEGQADVEQKLHSLMRVTADTSLMEENTISDVEFAYGLFIMLDQSCWSAVNSGDIPTAIRITQTFAANQFRTLVDRVDRYMDTTRDAQLRDVRKLENTKKNAQKANLLLMLLSIGVAGVFVHVIRQLERRQGQLRRSDARFRSLVQNSSDVIVMVDGEKQILYSSPSANGVLGYSPEHPMQGSWADIVPPEAQSHLDDVWHHVSLEQGGMRETESEVFDGLGARRPVEIRITNLLHDQNVGGIVLNIRDITERRQLALQLGLSQKLESVGRLAAGVAHELNTPIQFIGDNVTFLAGAFNEVTEILDSEKEKLAERGDAIGTDALAVIESVRKDRDINFLRSEIPPALEAMQSGIARIAAIVHSMKAFGNAGDTVRQPEDINDAINNTLVVARSEYKDVADVRTELATLPMVSCWIGDLNQVFLNLITNASHAIADVASETGQKGCITITSRRDDDHVVVSFQDTGGGIPLDVQDRVFDPFFTTKPVGQGAGQGLSLCRSIIERHNGTLGFDVEETRGTTFTIRLPINAL